MVTASLYTLLIAATAMERLFELRISKRNARWAFGNGGREYGSEHYPFMVALHTGLLAGCVVETWFAPRHFLPGLGFPMLALVAASQALRYWAITSLGPYWNTRVIVVPGMERVRVGPYRYLRHPNYVAVVLEGFALPLVHTNVITALVFTSVNAWLLRARIRCEEHALDSASPKGALGRASTSEANPGKR